MTQLLSQFIDRIIKVSVIIGKSDLRITGRSGERFRRIFPLFRFDTQCVPNWVLPKFSVNFANSDCTIVATVSQ